MIYYAKTTNGKLSTTVAAHCNAVAELARTYGLEIGRETEAYLCGLFHDFGKYSQAFQEVLNGTCIGIDHAIPGAAMMCCYRQLVEVIAGHHEHLKSYEELYSILCTVLKKNSSSVMTSEGKIVSICGMSEFSEAQKAFQADHPNFVMPDITSVEKPEQLWKDKLLYMLDMRMLYSCQIDADYTVSGELDTSEHVIDVSMCLDRLEAYRNSICSASKAQSNVNRMRNMVYRDAEKAAAGTDSFLTLTAPTGSGKTLAMLKFALERCIRDPTRKRIILVLPFLSLCDQAEEICKAVFPTVLIDHSNVQSNAKTDKNRDIAAQWNAPCIITTTVQFFQSLWSDCPGDCRKLHRLASSVILFDEIQSLPHSVCRYGMQSLMHLSERYGACVLLSTATQPAYQYLPDLEWHPTEVISEVNTLFSIVKRTGITFRDEPMTVEEVAAEAIKYSSACIIVNVKRLAKDIYECWKSSSIENCFLLYTNLCGNDRRYILDQIHDLQNAGKSVYVVSTQCIEAGVDLDFHQIFRQLAPLTSLIQSAGRQNRNGRWKPSNMIVFEFCHMDDKKRMYPGTEYEKQAICVKEMVNADYDLCDLSDIQEYYKRIFYDFQEEPLLSKALLALDYREFSRRSILIQKSGYRVVVPYDNGEQFQYLQQGAMQKVLSRKDLKNISGFTVQSYDRKGVEEHCEQIILRNWKYDTEQMTDIWVLLPGHEVCYQEHGLGLVLDQSYDDFYIL